MEKDTCIEFEICSENGTVVNTVDTADPAALWLYDFAKSLGYTIRKKERNSNDRPLHTT